MLLTRRSFLGAAALVPATARAWVPETPRPQAVADAALLAAQKAGATYADVRLVRIRFEGISTRDAHVSGVDSGESFGLGVRVLKGGAWGFASTPDATPEGA